MSLCRNGLHEMVGDNIARTTRTDRSSGFTNRCRACVNAKQARRRERERGDLTHPRHRGADLVEDVEFLFETGLGVRAIAAKLDIRYETLLRTMLRHGCRVKYDPQSGVYRLAA